MTSVIECSSKGAYDASDMELIARRFMNLTRCQQCSKQSSQQVYFRECGHFFCVDCKRDCLGCNECEKAQNAISLNNDVEMASLVRGLRNFCNLIQKEIKTSNLKSTEYESIPEHTLRVCEDVELIQDDLKNESLGPTLKNKSFEEKSAITSQNRQRNKIKTVKSINSKKDLSYSELPESDIKKTLKSTRKFPPDSYVNEGSSRTESEKVTAVSKKEKPHESFSRTESEKVTAVSKKEKPHESFSNADSDNDELYFNEWFEAICKNGVKKSPSNAIKQKVCDKRSNSKSICEGSDNTSAGTKDTNKLENKVDNVKIKKRCKRESLVDDDDDDTVHYSPLRIKNARGTPRGVEEKKIKTTQGSKVTTGNEQNSMIQSHLTTDKGIKSRNNIVSPDDGKSEKRAPRKRNLAFDKTIVDSFIEKNRDVPTKKKIKSLNNSNLTIKEDTPKRTPLRKKKSLQPAAESAKKSVTNEGNQLSNSNLNSKENGSSQFDKKIVDSIIENTDVPTKKKRKSLDNSSLTIKENTPKRTPLRKKKSLQPGADSVKKSKKPVEYSAQSSPLKIVEGKEAEEIKMTSPLSDKNAPSFTPSTPVTVKKGLVPASPLSVTKKNRKGETSLHLACKTKDFDAVQKLLNAGVDVNATDNAGWLPLHDAIVAGDLRIVKLLLTNDSLPDAPGLRNTTPLHVAVELGNLAIVKCLIEKGADPLSKDLFGNTPRSLAELTGDSQLLAVLQRECMTKDLKVPPIKDISLWNLNLLKNEKLKLNSFVRIFGVKVERKLREATHFIISKNSQCEKLDWDLMQSMANGAKIIKFEWIESCLSENKVLDFDNFIIRPNWLPGLEAAQLNRHLRRPGLFSGCYVMVGPSNLDTCTLEGENVNLKALRSLVYSSGFPMTRMPDPDGVLERTVPYHALPGSQFESCNYFIIYLPEELQKMSIKYNMPHFKCLPIKWLIDSIVHFKFLPFNFES